ncbi:MAG TPA: asparagine synthase (glutamine-hydrolyzing) [Solirubrobacteraceae bacterium]|nr:asparagine synthase (glutamine-hydrolyzing) [Solirubrobacteraceae bacterium]
MCGICGIAARPGDRQSVDEARLRSMTDAIIHRGPDEQGTHIDENVALGMRRLSIIDVGGSHQPISNEDHSVLAVFNGEIYNYRELRTQLRQQGHRFDTEGDGETIVHLYEEYGLDFARHLNGIFAIALWDSRRARLVLVRDQLGVKPLYYSFGPDGLAFASEVKSLIAAALVTPALDPVSAELFLALGFVPGPRSLFAGVEKLMPASLVAWDGDGAVEQRTYWSAYENQPDSGSAGAGVGGARGARLLASPHARKAGWSEDQAELLGHLRRATRAQMVSDVPLGSMLSGGLDSSLITALMAEHSTQRVKTYSIGFVEDAAANELGDARSVAERLGTDHHELLTSATDHPDLLDDALWHLEEPIADVSSLGFMLLSRLARESVTVALSGQGADELLGGYRKHQIAALAGTLQRAPRWVRGGLALAGSRADAGSTLARGLDAITTDDPVARLLAMSRVVAPADRETLLAPGFRQASIEDELERTIRAQLPTGAHGALSETLALDTSMALVDNMLLYFDKMSMASSLEVRVPFLDPEMVKFCTQLPDHRKVWLGRRKELLKRASQGLVDDEIITKRKRGFFHGALGAWLRVHRDALLSDTLLDPRALARGQYEPDAVRTLLAAAGEDGKKSDQRLFSLMLLERWQQIFVDGDGPAQRAQPSPPDVQAMSLSSAPR